MFEKNDVVVMANPRDETGKRPAKILCKFPVSDSYLLDRALDGYEYWEGRFLKKVGHFVETGPIPLSVTKEMEVILKQRYGICEGCKWHPNVCEYCEQHYSEENFFGEGEV